jgi:hypothetical protein
MLPMMHCRGREKVAVVQKETKRGRSKIRSWLRLFDGWTSIAGTLGDVAYKYRRGILQLYLGVFKAQVEDGVR